MTASSTPSPDDHDALSAWEQRRLADIEADLSTTDPHLARTLAIGAGSGTQSGRTDRWWPLSASSTVLLFMALILFVVVSVFVPASWWAVLGVTTAIVIVPCLLLYATERGGPG